MPLPLINFFFEFRDPPFSGSSSPAYVMLQGSRIASNHPAYFFHFSRCHFGRKRRSVRAPRVRRGWRIRRTFRRIGRFLRKVGRETKRVVKQVVTLPKCIVDNIVSRLSRSKEKAEREKNRLNQQLLQAQRAKVQRNKKYRISIFPFSVN